MKPERPDKYQKYPENPLYPDFRYQILLPFILATPNAEMLEGGEAGELATLKRLRDSMQSTFGASPPRGTIERIDLRRMIEAMRGYLVD